MALTYDSYTPVNGDQVLTAAVTAADTMLIRRPEAYIGVGTWKFNHIPHPTSGDAEFTLEATFSSLLNVSRTPGWTTITSTDTEIPSLASAVRIKSASGKDGGHFTTTAPGGFVTRGSTDTADTIDLQSGRTLPASRTTAPRQRLEMTSDGSFYNYVITIVSGTPADVAVTDIELVNDKLVSYTISRVQAGSATITATITPLEGGTAITDTRNITWN